MKLTVKWPFLLVLSSFLLGTATTFAATLEVVGAPTGFSSYEPGTPASGTTAATTPTIYGGMVADLTTGTMTGGCATPDASGVSPCDSCDGSGLVPCNNASIYPNLYLKVTMRSDTAAVFQGSPRIQYKIGNENYYSPDAPLPSLAVGTAFTVYIKWSNLCLHAGGTADCRESLSGSTLTIGINNPGDSTLKESVSFIVNLRFIDSASTTYTNYTQCIEGAAPASLTQGVCDFGVLPGDEKIYIHYFQASSNDLQTDHASIKYNRLVLFYASTFAAINNKSNNFPLTLKNNSPDIPSLLSRKITGLVNEERYCIALGNQDQAGNITYFTPASELNDADTAKVAKYCATPAQVVGLLDDKHCFIATATFGSQMAPEVITFRKFRNEFLLTNDLGRKFVRSYYKFGPVAAQWISESPFLKSLALAFLWPLLLFAQLSLALGMLPALLIGLIIAVALQRGVRSLWRRRTLAGEL